MRQIFYMINIFMWTKYSVWIRLELTGPDYNYQLIVSNQIIKSKKRIKHETLPKYNNADICKDQILSENKNKSGIYKWKKYY